MASIPRRVQHTYDEYLALEEESSTRHEYLDGEIYAMSGGTPDHAALAGAAIGILRNGMRAGCRVFTSDLRVRVPERGLTTYPDATVVCGATVRARDDVHAVVNPVLLVEVTSRSTEDYDRGEKLRSYQLIPSLLEVLIVSHRDRRVTIVRREPDGRWTADDVLAGGSVHLASVDARLTVDDLYRDGLEDAAS